MNKSAALLCAGLVGALALSAPGQAQTVTFGQNSPSNTGDCTPGCTPIIQTVYSASKFGTSPIQIDSISLFLSGSGLSDTYTFTLSTSRNGVGSLSSAFADNVGADAQTFWVGTPADSSNGWVTFSGTPFVYDPTAGDLLVEIDHPADQGSYSTDNLSSSYSGDGDAQRAYRFFGDAVDGPAYSFDTRFAVSAPGAVPEAATWAMMLGGFGLVGGALRKQRKSTIRFA